jgi:hypothetical protein
MSTVVYLSFGSLSPLYNNNKESASPIGELSNKARTYARDPAVFANTDAASVTELFNFLSQRDNADIMMPTELALVQVNIGDWLYAQAKQGNVTDSRPGTLALLQKTFTNNIEISDIGEMVTNNAVYFPSFIHGYHLVGAEKHEFYLWFSDAYFLDQYPKVSFTIVHPLPLEEMDSLMSMNYQQIEKRLALETPDVIEDRTHVLTNQAAWPYTERKVIGFQILDLINDPNYNMGFWRYVAWGNSADAEDQLFEQIQKEILSKSQYDRSQWEEKIPDLFNPLEWYVIPSFDRYGLLNKTNGAKNFSPVADVETQRVLVDKYLTPNMTNDHVIKSMQVVPFLYKSLSCSFVCKLNNREGMEKITALFPDYSLIESTDPDFDMMNSSTMEFIEQMENLLAAAEVVTPTSLPPTGITRVERFGQVYVARRIGKVKVLVLTKWQMLQDNVVSE